MRILAFLSLLLLVTGLSPKQAAVTHISSDKDVILVKGHVYHLDTQQPMAAKLFYYDLNAHQELGGSISDPDDGHFQLLLHHGHHYGLGASLKGFLPVFEELHLVDAVDIKVIERNVYLAPLKVGELVPLTNVHFSEDGKKLKPISYMALDHLVEVLNTHPTMEIEIKGLEHFGKAGYTQEHALNSALAIKKYLKKQKINKNRISCSTVTETELHRPTGFQEIFEVELLIKKM